LNIYKSFFHSYHSLNTSEKQQQSFVRDDYGILALKSEVISEKCGAVKCESSSDF
jgi:hypothetical protein